jgi:hypothetical protein
MFGAALVPSVAFFLALLFVPESPRYLVETGREEEAFRVLARVSGAASARPELDEIKETVAEESGSLRELFERRLRRPLLIAVALAILQQITGINTVFYYGALIFMDQVGGQSDSAAIGANVIIGTVNFFCTIFALWVIDRLGRRGFAEMIEHHRARPDLADRVGDAAPGDVGRGTVHRLEHRGVFALRVDVAGGRDSDRADAGRPQIAEDVAEQIGADHDVKPVGMAHEMRGQDVDVVLVGLDVGVVARDGGKTLVPIRHRVDDAVRFGR